MRFVIMEPALLDSYGAEQEQLQILRLASLAQNDIQITPLRMTPLW